MIQHIPCDKINLKHVRMHPYYEELYESIRKDGLFSAIQVKRLGDGRFELLDGCARLFAVMALGHISVPAIVAPERQNQMIPIEVKLIAFSGFKSQERFYLYVPDKGSYNLRRALWYAITGTPLPEIIKAKCLKVAERVSARFSGFGVFKISDVGTIVVKKLQITEVENTVSWKVEFQLESGLQWADTFECEINELADQVRERLLHRECLHDAAQVFEIEDPGKGIEYIGCSRILRYAGVTIGTAIVSKDE